MFREEKVLADMDERGEILLAQGNQAWDRGDRQNAEALFRQLMEEYPDRPEGYNKVGVVMAESGQLNEAEQYFLRALAQDRSHAPALTNLGNIYLERGHTDQAIQHYMLALSSDPDYPAAHRNLSVAYRRQGRYYAFVSHFKRSQRLDDRRAREEFRRHRGQAGLSGRPPRLALPPWIWWVIAGIGVVIILTVFHR